MDKKGKIVGCPACRGKKICMGLGMVTTTCAECKGIGYVEIFENPVAVTAKNDEGFSNLNITIVDASEDEAKLVEAIETAELSLKDELMNLQKKKRGKAKA